MPEKILPFEEKPVVPLEDQAEKEIGEIPKQPEVEQYEKELSPEMIEKIMEKVGDINAEGIAVHAITKKEKFIVLKRELEEGLLGQPFTKKKNISKEEWTKLAKKRDQLLVFFNIVGRDIESVEESVWLCSRGFENRIGIIFDPSLFREDAKVANYAPYPSSPYHGELKYKTKMFGANRPELEQRRGFYPAKEYKGPPQSEEGYALSFRVAPRWFRGIVFRIDRVKREPTADEIEVAKRLSPLATPKNLRIELTTYEEETNEEEKKHRVNEILSVMKKTYKEKETSFLPIYDIHGNLHWPKKMSYDDVKKLVAERKQNKEKEQ